MKRFALSSLYCILLLAMIVSAHATSYRIHELGLSPEGSAGLPCLGMGSAISSSNRVAGVVYDDGSPCVAVTNAAGELVLSDAGFALSVNASGQYVGYAGAAAKWDVDGNMTPLSLPTGTSFSLARAINDSGQAAGECWMGAHDVRNYVTLWNPGADPIVLGEGCGNAINANGSIAGSTRDSNGAHRAFLWTLAGGLMPLTGGVASEGTAVNDLGQVTGSIQDATGTWASVWDATGNLRVLNNLPGTFGSIANGINNSGAIVGTCDTATGSFAVVWLPDGSVQCLGELPGHTGSAAYAISNTGWVAGCSQDAAGAPHPVAWEFVPEPASVLALAVGLIGLAPLLRRRSTRNAR